MTGPGVPTGDHLDDPMTPWHYALSYGHEVRHKGIRATCPECLGKQRHQAGVPTGDNAEPRCGARTPTADPRISHTCALRPAHLGEHSPIVPMPAAHPEPRRESAFRAEHGSFLNLPTAFDPPPAVHPEGTGDARTQALRTRARLAAWVPARQMGLSLAMCDALADAALDGVLDLMHEWEG